MGVIRQHLVRGLFGMQLRTTILLAFLVLAATGLTGATYLRLSTTSTLAETKRHASDVAKALAIAAADAVETGDQSALWEVTEATVRNGELAYVIFADVTGQLLASHQRGAGRIQPFIQESNQVVMEPINQPQLMSHAGLEPTVDVVYPVQGAGVDPSMKTRPTVGFVRLGVSLAAAEARLQKQIRYVMGLAIVITLLMVPLGFEVVRRIVDPINRLSDAARKFAAGKLETRVDESRHDEIGDLSRAFNSMADELARSHNQLVRLNAELEDRVIRRTIALEDANRQLKEVAARDSLTGLYNRRYFNDTLERLFAEAARYGSDLTCLMMDLDYFKRVNDTLGHQAGDQLLRIASDVLRSTVRDSDIPVRFGGDEFAVLFPRTAIHDARACADRVLEIFRDRIAEQMPQAHFVSPSIGLASRDHDLPSSAEELVKLADEAMYLAKSGGKNRIMVVGSSKRPVHHS